MQLLLRAIISGFGYKIGAELGRFVVEKSGLNKKKKKNQAAEASATDDLPGFPTDASPPEDKPDEEPDPEDGDGDGDGEETLVH